MSMPSVERTPQAQLTTARLLLAQFEEQITEWRHMSPQRRRRTVRGKDLTARMDGLKAGRERWAARVAELEAQVATETP